MTYGTQILARSLSVPSSGANGYAHGNLWQYHPRSDRHSKIVCWGVFFDLLLRESLIFRHVQDGKVAFGINHRMRDFQNDRQKDLDLVICRRAHAESSAGLRTLAEMIPAYGIMLSPAEQSLFSRLPDIPITSVQTALIAMEAKAAFTEFGKARPRLYDELNSSHLTIHGDTDSAIAAGLALINVADSFVSPLRNPWSIGTHPTVINAHNQPKDAAGAIAKISQLPRRSSTGERGFDAVGAVVIDCKNDGSLVRLVASQPSPQKGEAFHYDSFIERIDTIYAARFGGI